MSNDEEIPEHDFVADLRATALLIDDIEKDDLSVILDEIGDARIVLLGQSTHGTSEFYRMRARLTRELVEQKGFQIIAVEADWPDAARIDEHIRGRTAPGSDWAASSGFPTWMWRNQEVATFVDQLRRINSRREADQQVRFYGLDLYSMRASVQAVLRYLDDVDPETAAVARARYACLGVEEADIHSAHEHVAVTEAFEECEDDVVAMLADLLQRRVEGLSDDPNRLFDTVQNARLVRNAERYYRALYHGEHSAWNLRGMHMADTLEFLLEHHKGNRKAVIWAHNSHVGDARHSERAARGEFNLGQMVKQRHASAYAIGFGMDHGTVVAAKDWGGPPHVMDVAPADRRSHEHLMHQTGIPAFFLRLSDPRVHALGAPRPQRAIGVIYRPHDKERHYIHTRLWPQYDGYMWFDRTHAIQPLAANQVQGVPATDPFGT